MLDRRDFITRMGGGIAVLITADESPAQERERQSGPPSERNPFPKPLAAWLHVARDGSITVHTGKVEVGQGAHTELVQVAAEELRVPVSSVKLVMGDTELTPFDMGTFGSRTTPTMVPQIRKAAATAREVLVDLAAKKWGVDARTLAAVEGTVRSTSGRNATYGELTQGQQFVADVNPNVMLTPPAEWKIAGKSQPRVAGEDIVTGRLKYVSDRAVPGMQHGKIIRPPSFGAKLESVDGTKAETLPGVKVVRDGDFLGVVAPDLRAAERAASLVSAKWTETPQPSGRELHAYLRQHAETNARPQTEHGDVTKALAASDIKLNQTYTVAYIAHAPLEPRVAIAEWNGDRLTVWTTSQRPFGVQPELAELFKMPEEKIRVIVPESSAAYGGKHMGDAALDAARLAKAVGKPVKVFWTREEEFTWAYFRPAGVIEVSSGAAKDGTLQAWHFTNINSGPAGLQIAYDIPNVRIAFQPSHTPLRQGSYRALAATANHFARETHIDELAHAVGMEPLEFRLKNTRDPRFRGVLEAAAKRFGWGAKPRPGYGRGIAAGWEKGSYVAACVELACKPGGYPSIQRMVQAFECGAVVNPDNLRNQIEGAMIMGLGGALFEAIEFDKGRILTNRFSKYRVPRFNDVPPIEIEMLDRKDLPSVGAGETPIVAVAPAIGNAIFNATGERRRSLPLARASG